MTFEIWDVFDSAARRPAPCLMEIIVRPSSH